jgi:hypothetical protein
LETATGFVLHASEPLPSSPTELSPQQSMPPEVTTAQYPTPSVTRLTASGVIRPTPPGATVSLTAFAFFTLVVL